MGRMRAKGAERARAADVCLLLEGTYPFVRGGVSGWMHQIITGLPELRFALLFVGGRRSDYGEPRYDLPDNVVDLQVHYLEDSMRSARAHRPALSTGLVEQVRRLHAGFDDARRGAPLHADGGCVLQRTMTTLGRADGVRLEHFMYSRQAWSLLTELCVERHPGVPFVDYFWTLRQLHGPIFQLAAIADGAPDASVYHTISTGYAGLLGAFIEQRRKRPLLLSEHGIYTKERRIDLNQAAWLDIAEHLDRPGLHDPATDLRDLWVRYFETLGRLTYRSATAVVSLYAGNQERQHADGADPRRTRVIVNGIDPERFTKALSNRPAMPPRVVGFIGRVVPIKDVKTFIRAIHGASLALPDIEGWIIGGADEDPAYARDCEALVESLGLTSRIRFLGHQNVVEMLPALGLLMLTSISEAQPLAVLEAFAAGVPCVTTDVGACREQIEGQTPADRALGLAGRVVPFADTEALSEAVVELLSSEDTWHACQRAGLARVQRYYTQQQMLDAYRGLYAEALEA